ncbi:MAG: iron complex outermembrane receptor protein [Lysobacterales bacterium]
MEHTKKLLVNAIYAALLVGAAVPVFAETTEEKSTDAVDQKTESRVTTLAQADDDLKTLEEVLITGTRSQGRIASDSTVPIDSFNAADLADQAHGDLTETIKNLVPSYSATPLTGDGSSFVRSTSLRGLPPDEVLVLVNSKRRHRSALIQQFGSAMSSGSHAVDIGHIPSIALKNVEVLRDGAAAQYGSDAIAGVLNFILNDADHGGTIEAQYGQFYEGETSYRVAGNAGFKLGENGFINLSFEWTDNEQLIRGFQPSAAAAAIAGGAPLVGQDSPYEGDTLAQTWGRPENDGIRTAWNIGVDLQGGSSFYVFGNYSETYGNYRFFYRDPNNSTLQPMPVNPNDPSQGNFCWCNDLPGGFTPWFTGDQEDFSTTVGWKGEMSDGTMFDVSLGYGSNIIDYTLFNSLNSSWGPQSPRDFDTGDLLEEDYTLNIDFSRQLNDKTNMAWGLEMRQENYVITAGDVFSRDPGPYTWVNFQTNPETGLPYSAPPIGASGRSGFGADSAGTFTRDNFAAYVDVEWDVSDDTLIQAAGRVENFDDFGTTANGKLAFRHNLNDNFTLRGAVSTGFRAPTPGQSNVTSIVTTFDGTTGLQTQQGTVKPTDPLAVSLGGKALEPEESTNISIGFTASPNDDWTITFDIYSVDVDDRIVKTQDIPIVNPLFTRLSFYTNALQTETDGFDLVALYEREWDNGSNTDFSFAWNHNETDVTGQTQVNGIDPVSAGNIFNIENNLPDDRISLTARHYSGAFTTTLRANYYGETIDERNNREPVGSATFVDFSVAYQVNDDYAMTLGANNVFDEYPNTITTRLGNGLAYPRRTPMGYDGGMWYLRGVYTFN